MAIKNYLCNSPLTITIIHELYFLSSLFAEEIVIVKKKKTMIDPKFPQTLKELISVVKANDRLRNPRIYRVEAYKYDLPPMPHVTYRHEGKTQDEIWKLLFPNWDVKAKVQIKSFKAKDFISNDQKPKTSSNTSINPNNGKQKRSQTKQNQDNLAALKDSNAIVLKKDGLGYLKQFFLISKLRKLNITSETKYAEFAPIFSDWPNDPAEYYPNWVGWDDVFKEPLGILKIRLQTNID